MAYRVYVTDCLYSTGMTSIKERFWDWTHKTEHIKDTRTADEIALDVIHRAGLQFQGGEE